MIDSKHLEEVCKIGQGKDCCAFLTAGAQGIQCAKNTEFEEIIRRRIPTMNAQSDNCEGYVKEVAIQIEIQ